MQNAHLLTVFIFVFFINNLSAQPFEVDPIFGKNGRVMLSDGPIRAVHAQTMIVQEDQKVVIVLDELQVIRVDEQGDLDENFGIGGKVMLDLEIEGTISIRNLALQPSGKLVLTGYVSDANGKETALIVRLTKNGILDEAFGTEGIVLMEMEGFSTSASSAVSQKEGELIIVGQIVLNPNENRIGGDLLMFKLTENGDLDKKFGAQGITRTAIEDENAGLLSVELDNEGAIVTAGYINDKRGNRDLILLKYQSSGRIDTTFGVMGKQVLDFNTGNKHLETILIQDNGNITVIGHAKNLIKDDIMLVRYDNNGELDTTFGDGGIVLTDLSGSQTIALQSKEIVETALARPNNHILISGYTFGGSSSIYETFFVQYKENGLLDNDFGDGGVLITGSWDSLRIDKMISQSDGKVIASARKFPEEGRVHFLTRYLPDLRVGTISFSTKENKTLVYPNPILNTATLAYTLESSETLTIQLTNLNGQLLKTYLQNKIQKAGTYQQQIDLPTGLPTGMYFIRLSSPNGQTMIKVTK